MRDQMEILALSGHIHTFRVFLHVSPGVLSLAWFLSSPGFRGPFLSLSIWLCLRGRWQILEALTIPAFAEGSDSKTALSLVSPDL